MRTCLINDCTGFVGVAPCCLDCEERQGCPDRCPRSETTYCVGVIDNDGKRISASVQKHTARD